MKKNILNYSIFVALIFSAVLMLSCNRDEPEVLKTFTVEFNSNGGNEIPAQIVEKGTLATKPVDPIREGYTFIGWYQEIRLINEWDFSTDLVTNNIRLHAKWMNNWRLANTQWYEQERARLCDETGEKFWTETESGLLYRIIYQGIGGDTSEYRPNDGSVVMIDYVGRLFNGVEFDRRPPESPLVGRLIGFIPGFQEVLRMMRQNAIYEVIIPYELGYGNNRMGVVPPYSMLEFRVGLHFFFSER